MREGKRTIWVRPAEGREADGPGWAEEPAGEGFRETFLASFAHPDDREVVRELGNLLVDVILGGRALSAVEPAPQLRRELEAVVADLRHLSRFLRDVVGLEGALEGLEVREARWVECAALWGQQLGELAATIQGELSPPV